MNPLPPNFKCHGWENGKLTYTVGKDTIEIIGDQEFNNWEHARLNGDDYYHKIDELYDIQSVYNFLKSFLP